MTLSNSKGPLEIMGFEVMAKKLIYHIQKFRKISKNRTDYRTICSEKTVCITVDIGNWKLSSESKTGKQMGPA